MLKEVAIGFISNSKGHTKDTEADKAEYSFLQTVSTGVSNRLAIARVYSSSFAELFGGWEPFIANIDTTLKLLVASKREIEDNPTLKAGYNNDTSNPQLFGYPLIFIEDYTFYINSPDNKRALWLQLQDSIKKND
jgi:hypothetical protein